MIKLRKRQKGFTLVELLIVIAIIAVLAAVVTPMALGAVADSKATAVYAEVKSIETAALTEYVSSGTLKADFNSYDMSGLTIKSATEAESNNATYLLTAGNPLTLKVTPKSNVSGQLATLLGTKTGTAPNQYYQLSETFRVDY